MNSVKITHSPEFPAIPPTYTTPEAQKLTHYSKRKLQDLMYSGQLKYYKLSQRHVLIDAVSLASLFKSGNSNVVEQIEEVK